MEIGVVKIFYKPIAKRFSKVLARYALAYLFVKPVEYFSSLCTRKTWQPQLLKVAT